MRKNTAGIAATLAIVGTLLLAGCKKSAPPAAVPSQSSNPSGAATQPADSTTSSANPGAAPVPAPAPESAPVTQAPPPAATSSAAPAEVAPPPPPAPIRVTARAGTPVAVTITEQLSASHNNVGDRFTGVLAEPVRSSGGAAIFPRGTRVAGTVVAAKGRGRFKGSGALGIQLTSIAGTPVNVSSYEKEAAGKGKRSAGFIGGGGGAGALIGGIAGGGKGALLGGLLGAGAGTAGAAFTGNKDVVIPSESRVTFHLTSSLTVTR
jgi:hypothetical protein